MHTEPTNPNQLELFIGNAPAFEITSGGIVIRDNLTFEEWKSGLGMFRTFQKHLKTAFGDYIAFGRVKWGSDAAIDCLKQLEFDMPIVSSSIAISSIPMSIRHDSLSGDHYIAIAKAKISSKEQAYWSRTAVEQSLTPAQLKASIEAGEVVSESQAKRNNCGVLNIHGIRQDFEMWKSRVGEEEGIQKMSTEARHEIASELLAFYQLYEFIMDSLSDEAP